ncbi:MBL fold metallo-hydrolase [Acidianus manzaensis]|uniref:MBL fold metallo-hydrolase n=1 Tax=Acidianus manzaensis TaxID=282676 RepID=A0A1W6JZ47_9CREN|nr:MBL fold metallo-hydrolase [Acidianus manzaensis]ARM75528.1 MBL fold metallo-hydrolase [Acidianus manzaensis]
MLYTLRLPIKGSLNHVNTYLLGDIKNFLLIDTGLPTPEDISTLTEYLKKYGSPKRVLITHYHPDHIGLVSLFAKSAEILINEKELEFLNFIFDDNYDHIIGKFLSENGFPKEYTEIILQNRNRIKEITKNVKFTEIKDNDEIIISDKKGKFIWTPGHTIGHTCLYYEKLLFCGDHILPHITPNVSLLRPDDNPLKEYIESLERIMELDVEKVYPAHGDPFTNIRERINEIKKHHERRLQEIINILQKRGKANAYEISTNISWYKPWQELGNIDKQLAIGETLAHIKYLQENNTISMHDAGNVIFYTLK